MKHIKTSALLLAVSVAISTVGCTQESADTGTEITVSTVETSAATAEPSVQAQLTSSIDLSSYNEEDLNSSWDADSAVTVNFDGDTISVSGSGASASGGDLTITRGGTYVLGGTLDDGQIIIAAGSQDTVRLVLNGVSVSSSVSSAIYASQADKLIITLADGTENNISDASSYTYAIEADEEPDAAIFSKDDLTINGSGFLTVTGNFKNGIGTKDDLLIVSGTYNITAVNDALRGRDSVTVLSGDFTLNAGGDGIQSNNDGDTSKGWITLGGGTYDITAVFDGVQAETTLSILDGEYAITTLGTDTVVESDSFKGLKAGAALAISGGSFNIDSADDCVHSNGDVLISGGNFTLISGDDGMHADGKLSITDGVINITKSYEGLEGATVLISGGETTLNASDDGINAAGGNDSGIGGRFGQDAFSSSGAYYIDISGGSVVLTAGGDGIDSNGDVTISGGSIVSLINSSSDNGAVDCDQGTLTITGGTLIYGGTGVGSVPGGSSTQSYAYTNSVITAGTEITLQDSDGDITAFTPAIDCRYLAISAPEIVSGESYGLYGDGELLAEITAGTGAGMGAGMGGEVPADLTSGREMPQGGGRGGGRGGGTPPDGAHPSATAAAE